jgi:hypothetical protein
MKRTIFLTIIFVLFTCVIAKAATAIDLTKTPPPPPTPDVPTYMLPVSATIDASELAVYFESSVGDATITVYDESNNIIYQGVVDTNSEMSVSIPSSSWNAGNYSLSITFGTTEVTGDFVME